MKTLIFFCLMLVATVANAAPSTSTAYNADGNTNQSGNDNVSFQIDTGAVPGGKIDIQIGQPSVRLLISNDTPVVSKPVAVEPVIMTEPVVAPKVNKSPCIFFCDDD